MPTRAVAAPERRGHFQEWVVATGLSRTQLACAVLQATALGICLALVIWMLLLITKPRRGIEGWWVAQGNDASTPWVGSPALDVAALAATAGGSSEEVEPGKFLARFEHLLETNRAGSLVLFVSAAAVGDLEVDGGYVPPRSASPVAAKLKEELPESEVLAADLIKRCKDYPRVQKLLIWDAGQIGSDRNLGVFGNGFIASLARALAKEKSLEGEEAKRRANLAVLVSCAPGQTSWWSDFDGRSVFGYFVEQGLQAGGSPRSLRSVTVQDLVDYVGSHVTRWVKEQRQAEQTPLLLSDRPLSEVNFRLPRIANRLTAPSPAPTRITATPKRPAPDQEAKAAAGALEADETLRMLDRLEKAWEGFEQIDRLGLLHRNPGQWLRYHEQLQRAERFFRGGDLAQAKEVLDRLRPADMLLRESAPKDPISIAEIELNPSAANDAAARTANQSLEDALDELVAGGDSSEPRAGADDPPAENDPVPAGPAPEVAKGEPEKREGPAPIDPAVRKQAPKGEAPPRGFRVSAKRSRPRSPQAGDVFLELMNPVEREVPRYLENQLLVWARVFTHTRLSPVLDFGPDASAFHGVRGELLRQAIEVRRIAEHAAATDPRVLPWVRPLIESADKKRRIVQDRLFTTSPPRGEPLSDALHGLEVEYRDARRVAEETTRALHLVDRIVASAPGYALWLLRRPGRLEADPAQPVVAILDQARELAGLLAQDPGSQADEIRRRVQAINKSEQALRRSFEEIEQVLRQNIESASRWRELDAVLCAAVISARQRRSILERIGKESVAGSVLGEEAAVASAGGVKVPGGVLPVEDPGARAVAVGLARLELKLIGIVPWNEGLASRVDELKRACDKAAQAPERAERATRLAEIAAEIRKLRQERLQTLNDHLDTSPQGLLVRDLLVRALPLSDLEHMRGEASDPGCYLRQSWLVWQAQRLLKDSAPQHAAVTLAVARQAAKAPPELDRAIAEGKSEAGQLTRAFEALTVELPDGRAYRLEKESERRMPLTVRGGELFSDGEATVFVAFDPTLPVTVTDPSQATQADFRTGVLAGLGRDSATRPLAALVSRSEPTRRPVDFDLRHGIFYRGQIRPRDPGTLKVAMSDQGGIEIELRQTEEQDNVRKYGDQFKRHRNRGFLHPSTRLACTMVISHNYTRPTTVRVRHGFQDKEHGDEAVQTIVLAPGSSNEEVRFEVQNDRDQIPEDRPREYSVEILAEKDDRKVLYQNRFPFRTLRATEIVAIEFAGLVDPPTGTYAARVRHLKSDPVSGPVEVAVSLGGHLPGRERWMLRGRDQLWYWWGVSEGGPAKLILSVDVGKKPNAITRDLTNGPEPPAAPATGAAKPPAL